MSVDISWEKLTGGPDGDRRAERIRSFIHDKFQQVPFPKFIRSVQVHSFSFGTLAPEIEIKDICDPYPEFYEQDEEEDTDTESADDHTEDYVLKLERELRRRERKLEPNSPQASRTSKPSSQPPPPYSVDGPRPVGSSHGGSFRNGVLSGIPDSFPGRVGVTGSSTPLFSPIPAGGSSNLHYFHSALSPGFTTPQSPALHRSTPSTSSVPGILRGSPFDLPGHGVSSSAPRTPRPIDPGLAPRDVSPCRQPNRGPLSDDGASQSFGPNLSSRLYQPRDEDTQIIARVRYAGDVRLELTAELLFEYPVANFVGLPVRLVVTGCTFDGIACVAYIRRRAHFCFLDEDSAEGTSDSSMRNPCVEKSLLRQINVESEIGEKGKGKQVLKNVGKVERFVLEQVRRIFEEEFVFPSSWTFLV
ncbi:hypothetical protein EX30DRAFT_337100 [Ascodesmis nigricans]|uniref:Mitochondrial distribution and morphology protein 12 n=1 Tax=Ascodesmis nigricans TaxID=341454 RepID=A0A4V3SJM8_9PEZI|nr:hypothetical protein EX30DRAFT_337100 [Ascodesmis nigricans]